MASWQVINPDHCLLKVMQINNEIGHVSLHVGGGGGGG